MTTIVVSANFSNFIPWDEISQPEKYAGNQLFVTLTCTSYYENNHSVERIEVEQICKQIDSLRLNSWWSWRNVNATDERFILSRQAKTQDIKIICGSKEDLNEIKNKLVYDKLKTNGAIDA